MQPRTSTTVLAAIFLAVSLTQPVRGSHGLERNPASPALETTRTFVQDELRRLGRDVALAARLAGELTADDLAVLFANPRMMQPAGAYSAQSANLMAALLLLGGIIALAAASDGSVLLFN